MFDFTGSDLTMQPSISCDSFQFSVQTMGDWLHCNTCFQQPGDGRNYFLTSCGHLYCDRCQSKGWKETCLLCETRNPSAVKLTGKLVPTVEAFFTDPLTMMKQILKEMKQLISTAEFQHHQRRRLIAQLQKQIAYQKAAVDQHQKQLKDKVRGQFEAMTRELNKLKDENNYLKRLLSEKAHGMLRNPLISNFSKCGNSPVQKGYGSPGFQNQPPCSASTGSMQKRISPCISPVVIAPGRISVRTPPSGGRMGIIPGTPSPQYMSRPTPKSVPHPIGFGGSMETSPS